MRQSYSASSRESSEASAGFLPDHERSHLAHLLGAERCEPPLGPPKESGLLSPQRIWMQQIDDQPSSLEGRQDILPAPTLCGCVSAQRLASQRRVLPNRD